MSCASVAPPAPDGRRCVAEKIMRKTHDGSSLGRAAFEARTLDDAELNAVTGGSLTLSYGEIRFEYTAQSPASAAPPVKHWFNGG